MTKCKHCGDCCGVVPFSNKEKKNVEKKLPHIKFVRFNKEAWVLKSVADLLPLGIIPSCPFLSKEKINRCSIYDIRPDICKKFGTVKNPLLTCPHKTKESTND